MVFRDTAIAIGTFRGKGTDASGKLLDVNERFDTWTKMAETMRRQAPIANQM